MSKFKILYVYSSLLTITMQYFLPDVIKYLIYAMFYVMFYFRVTLASLFMRFK